MRVAIATVIKNEQSDLASWLAWYHVLGVDTVLLFDDHSDDATWQVAEAASRHQDIRLLKTDPTIRIHWDRQNETFRRALRDFGADYDWMGFLDGDEYLFLPEDGTVQAFLQHYEHANGVAVSWCVYGSNGHILKPHIMPVEAFTMHSALQPSYNVMKSFVRPNMVGPTRYNVHRYDVPQPYVDPQGDPVVWTEHGHSANAPDWSRAKLMHYIGRSMEHVIDRIRRRANLRLLTDDYYNHLGKNEVEDLRPLREMAALYRQLHLITRSCIASFLAACRDADPAPPEATAQASDNNVTLFRLRTLFGSTVCLDTETGELCHTALSGIEGSRRLPIVAARLAQLDNMVFLISPVDHMPLRIARTDQPDLRADFLREHRISEILSYRVDHSPEVPAGVIALRNPQTDRYLSADFRPHGTGNIHANRGEVANWELFWLAHCGDEASLPLSETIRTALATVSPATLTDHGLLAWARAGERPPALFSALFTLLPSRARASFLKAAPCGPLPDWIMH